MFGGVESCGLELRLAWDSLTSAGIAKGHHVQSSDLVFDLIFIFPNRLRWDKKEEIYTQYCYIILHTVGLYNTLMYNEYRTA